MKKLMLFFVFLSIAGYIHILKAMSFPRVNIPTVLLSDKKADVIDIGGTMTSTGTRPFSVPVSAVNYSEYIEVTLPRFLGEISIRIYDEANDVVYEEIINASTQSRLLISTASLSMGTYRIEFTNSQGKYLEGDFVVE